MNVLRLSWRNISFRPWSTLLSIILFALGVGLISFLFQVQHQLQKNFEQNLAGVDLVVGAKGSPLQLILSSMYHIDAPTGNISLQEARPFLNPKHPLIADAVPLSLGDSYRSYRIVGTSSDIVGFYEATINEGRIWSANFEVTIGATVAKEIGLKLGDTFQSSHGFEDSDEFAHEHTAFKVVGILAPGGTVLDQLILTTTQSFWLVHEHEGEAEEIPKQEAEHNHNEGHEHHEGHAHEGEHAHDEHDHHAEHPHDDEHDHHAGHDHEHHDGHAHGDEHDQHEGHEHGSGAASPPSLLEEPGEKEITSLLIRFKGRNFQALNLQRNINENTDLQAATPAIEINRLYSLMNTGEEALRILALVIILVSGLSIFISLYASLNARKYELALLRVMGGTPAKLFQLILTEGLLLTLIGFGIGILLSHLGMQILAGSLEEAYRYQFDAWHFLPQEGYLLLAALGIGLLASLIPAQQAARTDIADTLTEG